MKNFEKYCTEPEKIENYEKAKKDNFKGWDCHHRLETHNSDGERRLVDITKKELKALGMYYNRPSSELIFLTSREHKILHNKGKKMSEETRKKLREANKGEHNPMYGKKHSFETINKMSEAHKNISEETRNKMREAKKGNKHALGCKRSEEAKNKIAEAMKGNKHALGHRHTEETKNKIGEAKKGENNPAFGKHWYNNGKINVMSKECPEGFVPGILR